MVNKLYYRLEKIFKYILNFLTTLLLVLLFLTLIKPFSDDWNFLSPEKLQLYSLVLQIASIILSVLYDFIVKYNIFHAMFVYNMIGTIKEKTIIQNSRAELRNSLNIIAAVTVLCILYQYIMTKNLIVLITALLILFLAYLYADYMPYTMLCGKFYDSKFLKKNEKRKMCRGLARIYLEEYKITKFDRKHSFYSNIQDKLVYQKDNKYQDECIREILRNWADYLTAPDLIINLIMFIINFLMLIASTQLEDIVKIYVPEGLSSGTKELILMIFLIIINIIFSYISYKGINSCRKGNEKTEEICEVIKSKDKKKRFEFFKKEYPNINKTVLSRGTYEFNLSYTTNQDLFSEYSEIDFPYRTLFIDRYHSHKQRFNTTSTVLILIILSIQITFVVPIKFIILTAILNIMIALILRKYWLPNIGKKRVSKYCEELLKENKF